MSLPANWIKDVEQQASAFAKAHGLHYAKKKREIAASFEIGCFHALLGYYKPKCELKVKNPVDGEYRYLTTPNGNPAHFSYVKITNGKKSYELRQQLRIRSHIHPDIAFSPDLVVVVRHPDLGGERDSDYAGGKRGFYRVDSSDVIAAHECKSLVPFPELLVSFIGMLTTAHSWFDPVNPKSNIDSIGLHLAPTLFVGGSAKPMQRRMIKAIQAKYPVNIISGLHRGTWGLTTGAMKVATLDI